MNDGISYQSNRGIDLPIAKQARKVTMLKFSAFNYRAEQYTQTKIEFADKGHMKSVSQNRVIVAHRNGTFLGYAELDKNLKKLSYIGVADKLKDSGIGSGLIKASIEWFIKRDIKYFTIHSTNGSFDFYRKFFLRNHSIEVDGKSYEFFETHAWGDKGDVMFMVRIL